MRRAFVLGILILFWASITRVYASNADVQVFTVADLHAEGRRAMNIIRHIETTALKRPNTLIIIADLGDLIAFEKVAGNEDIYGNTMLGMFDALLKRYSNIIKVTTLDNHMFDMGLDRGMDLMRRHARLGPMLGANVLGWKNKYPDAPFSDVVYIDPFAAQPVSRQTADIAFTGMLTPRLLAEGIITSSDIEPPRALIESFETMRLNGAFEGVRVLFVANHVGMGDDIHLGDAALIDHIQKTLQGDAHLMPRLEYIFVMSAHDHNLNRFAQDPELAPKHHYVRHLEAVSPDGRRVEIKHVESLAFGKGLGHIELRLPRAADTSVALTGLSSHAQITAIRNINKISATRYPATAQASRVYERSLSKIQDVLNEVIGRLPITLSGSRVQARTQPGTIAMLPALAYRDAALYNPEIQALIKEKFPAPIRLDRVIGVYNGTGARGDLPAGPLTRNDIFDALTFVYNAPLYIAQYRGATIREICEQAVRLKMAGTPFWIHFAGLDFDANYDPAYGGARRVHEIRVWGKPLVERAVYTFALDQFYFIGGNDQPAFRDYIRAERYPSASSALEWFIRARLYAPPDQVDHWLKASLTRLYPELMASYDRAWRRHPMAFHFIRTLGDSDVKMFGQNEAVIFRQGLHHHRESLSDVMAVMSAFHAFEKARTLKALKNIARVPDGLDDLPAFPYYGRWFKQTGAHLFSKQNYAAAQNILKAHERRVASIMGRIYRLAASDKGIIADAFPYNKPNQLLLWLARSGPGHSTDIDSSWRVRYAPLVYALIAKMGIKKMTRELPKLEIIRIGGCL